jgi:hypothetical protein
VCIGAWSIPSARESATTPTISAGGVHDTAPVMPLVIFQLMPPADRAVGLEVVLRHRLTENHDGR